MARRLVLLPVRIPRSPSSRRLVWTSAHAELTAVFPPQMKQGGCTQAGLQHAATVPEDMGVQHAHTPTAPARQQTANGHQAEAQAGKRHIGTNVSTCASFEDE
jgi:hypothetical protein